VKHEGIGIPAKLGNDEGHSLSHQAGDKRYIARQPIQFGATTTLHFELFAAASAAAS
jgi:hypothetical protein